MSSSENRLSWFWNRFDSAIAGTLSDSQKNEINRILGNRQSSGEEKKADIRLSFGWYYLVIMWGKEKRRRERLNKERKLHPVVTLANAPVIIFFWVGLILSLYSLVVLGIHGLALLLA